MSTEIAVVLLRAPPTALHDYAVDGETRRIVVAAGMLGRGLGATMKPVNITEAVNASYRPYHMRSVRDVEQLAAVKRPVEGQRQWTFDGNLYAFEGGDWQRILIGGQREEEVWSYVDRLIAD